MTGEFIMKGLVVTDFLTTGMVPDSYLANCMMLSGVMKLEDQMI